MTWAVAVETMGELKPSNQALMDRNALNAAWDSDGYLFFRDVLDRGCLERLRQAFLGELAAGGWIAPRDITARYTGKGLDDFPFRMEPLVERRPAPWRSFVAEPSIDNFFTKLLGEPPYWIPNTDYRATPPTPERVDRFVAVHQDGFYNDGIEFFTCWIPLSTITPQIGGLSLSEGQHKRGYLHNHSIPPTFPIPTAAIPETSWRRATYDLGDLIVFHPSTPHTGWTNLSDRFRLSLDIRMMRLSAPRPFVGVIVSISPDWVVVEQDESLGIVAVRLAESTYCRGIDVDRVDPENFASVFLRGDHVTVSYKHGVAQNLRHSH